MDGILLFNINGDPIKYYYQWDSEQSVMFKGVNAGLETDVHFCNIDSEKSFVVSPTVSGDSLIAKVPNKLLQCAKPVIIYLYKIDDTTGNNTIYSARITVVPRPKPADYVYTETEILKYSQLDERIKALEDGGVPNGVKSVNGQTPDKNGNVEIEVSGGNVDLTGYAKEQWVKQNYQPKGEYLTAVPDGYAKIEDIPTRPEDIGAQPSGNYALKSEIPSVPVQSVNGKTGAVQLSAADVNARPSNWMPTAQEVGALPDTYVPPNQTAAQVGADPAGTAAAVVSTHNTSTDSHGDLRLALKAINDRLTAFFDCDDTTLDELSEIVASITSNKTLIDSITTSKVSVADIINNLTTNVANKPLSAAQGVALKGLIDAVSSSLSNYQPKGDYALRSELPTVPTKVSQLQNDKGYLTKHQDISGKLDADKLPEAVNAALAQAKDSGEFDGDPGAPGVTPHIGSNGNWYIGSADTGVKAQGKDGTSVTVKSVSESTADGGSNVVTFSDGKTLTVKNGKQGSDGKTPVRGVDYYTEADKAEIVAMVIESLGGNPVFGIVDENNNIVVSGNLPDGTYSVKYEMENGTKLNIGNLVLDTNVYYTVTNTLTNCTNSNSATQAIGGQSYSATITAKSGYELKSVTVTMGGTAVSVSNGKISIANVTGNIVITAVAEEVTVEIVNLIPISTNADGSLYKGTGGQSGYKLKTRVKLSNGDEAVHNSSVCTGFMPCKYNDTLYIKGITVVNDPNQTNEAICFYNSNHAFIASVHAGKALGAVSGGVASVKFNETGTGKTEINSSAGIAYFRLSANTIDSNSVITINQPL